MIQEGKRYQYKNGQVATVIEVSNNTVFMSNGDTINIDKFNQYCNPAVVSSASTNIYDSYQDNQLLNEAYNNTTNYNIVNSTNTNTATLNASAAILGVLSDFNNGNYVTNYRPSGGDYVVLPQESAPMLTDETGVVLQPSHQMYNIKPPTFSPLPGLATDNYDIDEFMTLDEIEAVNKLRENAYPIANPNLAFQQNPYANGMPVQQNNQHNQQQNNQHNQQHNQQRAQAPISPAKDVLSKIKKNYEIDFVFKLKTLIPNLEYLKMSQENLDCDLFDALAEDLTNNFMNNPSLLYSAILSQLKGDDMVEIFKNAVKVEPKPIETPKKAKVKKVKNVVKAVKEVVKEEKETIKAETKLETITTQIEETYDTTIYPKVETIETIVLTPINK